MGSAPISAGVSPPAEIPMHTPLAAPVDPRNLHLKKAGDSDGVPLPRTRASGCPGFDSWRAKSRGFIEQALFFLPQKTKGRWFAFTLMPRNTRRRNARDTWRALQREGEVRCTHAEERCSATSKISDFRQEEDYVLLYREREAGNRVSRCCPRY